MELREKPMCFERAPDEPIIFRRLYFYRQATGNGAERTEIKMTRNDRNASPLHTRSQNKKRQRRSRSIIFILQVLSLFLCLSVIVLSSLLIARTIKKNEAAMQKQQPVSTTAPIVSETSAATSTTSAAPTPVPVTERLPASPNAESFFGEFPAVESLEEIRRFPAKAIYISDAQNVESCIGLANRSEVDSFVVDLKESSGVRFASQHPLAPDSGPLHDSYSGYGGLRGFIEKCHENDIKIIGRIVCFKDPEFARKYPERSIRDESGNQLLYTLENSTPFLSPYDTRNWDYLIELALEAVEAGIDEIQFDYVRFPTGNTVSGTSSYYGDPATLPTRAEAINRFLQTARRRIQDEYGIPVSADIFGIVLSSETDGEYLGQDWSSIGLTGVSVLAPMVYPSHYALNTVLNEVFFEMPDFHPHDVVYNALMHGKPAADAEGFSAVRPYLQAFTASYITPGTWQTYDYGKINDQIRAVYDAGYEEWILWNATVQYPDGAYDGNN